MSQPFDEIEFVLSRYRTRADRSLEQSFRAVFGSRCGLVYVLRSGSCSRPLADVAPHALVVLELTLLVPLLPTIMLVTVDELQSELALDDPRGDLCALLVVDVFPRVAVVAHDLGSHVNVIEPFGVQSVMIGLPPNRREAHTVLPRVPRLEVPQRLLKLRVGGQCCFELRLRR